MANREKIQYVRYYTAGTAARKLQPEPERRNRERNVPRPQPKAEQEPVLIPFDPIAVIGTAVAVALVLCVLVGFVQVNQVNDQISAMENHLSTLRSEHYALEKKYEAGIDLQEVQNTAEALGLVPIARVEHITIQLPEPEVAQELPWWQEFWNDLRAMFE